ncbi:HI0074 family nucleotidyltransferase substrate-binding subunit [Methanobrevibacter filiformis]|uniref:Nucleotidyltransferase substrate binding protein like protein n=1 Tax=Methanobrevibacter filiformis TaxID=55758 RepID=A0A165YXJ6_9EURY|nr:HI0074 family nucleotidyltransferase substrate-binding subunit [Methanobrevibacter filiformis]KZX09989.1 nucleotidyltransferase substrate binding protein like protein [Methanobrevibacter filiformis]
MGEKLNITPLLKAYKSFITALDYAEEIESENTEFRYYTEEMVKSAVIQHFEYTYELTWKMMKKFLKVDIGDRADTLSRPELFRIIGEKQLITDFSAWNKYNKARNKTSYTYNEDIAEEVYNTAKNFKNDLKEFITALKERTNIVTY